MIIFNAIPNQYGVVESYILVDVDLDDTPESHNEIGLCFMEQLPYKTH